MKGVASSLTTQNTVDSGLPRSTRTINSSITVRPDRHGSPVRRVRSDREETEDARLRDYERIRAAVLQRGRGGRDKLDFERDSDSITSSDEDRSVEEFKAFPSKSADRARTKYLVPTSTPLVKQASTQPRAWSEGRAEHRRGKGRMGKHVDKDEPVISGQESWRHLGGHTFFESERLAARERRDDREGVGGYNREPIPQKSGSLPQHSRQRQSPGQRRAEGDDLVLRSAEYVSLTPTSFPSDLSRITQGSGHQEGTTEAGMWRYRSLEDLIGGRSAEAAARLKIYKDAEGEKDNWETGERHQPGRLRKGEHEISLREPSDTWYGRGGKTGGPVQAMNSEFWERYRSEEDEEEEEDRRWHEQKKVKGGAKIQRSTSEQSLHTLRSRDILGGGADEGSFGLKENTVDGVDTLLAHYLSPARSSFDLRPFTREEHF